MKLTAEDFQYLENSFDDRLRDVRATALYSGQYGLLPSTSNELLLRNLEGARVGTVRVVVEHCRAVLPGGQRVEILKENILGKKIPLQAPEIEFTPVAGMRYWIYLCVDEYGLAKAGIPQLRPTRYPHVVPKYYLECLSLVEITVRNTTQNRMKIAEWQDGKIIETYIPACLTLQGHSSLVEWHRYLQNVMENIVQKGLIVIENYRGKDLNRVAFCKSIIEFIRSSQGYYRLQLPMQAPISLIAYFTDFIGLIQSLIETGDREFVRNELKDGKINALNRYSSNTLSSNEPLHENMLNKILVVKGFLEAVVLTLESLNQSLRPNPNPKPW